MFSLSSNFLRSTTIMELTCHGMLLLISSSNTSGDNNNLFMPVIDVSFNLKLVYEFKSWGDFIVYSPSDHSFNFIVFTFINRTKDDMF